MRTAPTYLTPAGGAWACQQCTASCRSFTLGPVEPEVIARLTALGVTNDWAPASESPWYNLRSTPDGAGFYTLAYRGDGCVFLRDDGLCAIHALYGADSKPGFCRAFPIELVEEPRGIAVIARPACDRLHETFRNGTPLAQLAPEVDALHRLAPRRRFFPEKVEVFPGVWVSLAAWMGAEAALCAALAEPLPPAQAVAAAVAQLAGTTGTALPPASPQVFRTAARASFEALRIYLGYILESEANGPAHRVAFVREVRARVEEARFAPDLTAPMDARAQDYATMLLRSAILAKDIHTLGGAVAGLGAWLLGALLAQAVHAVAQDTPMTAADFAAHHTPWVKLAAHPALREVMKKARPALIDLALHASAAEIDDAP